MTRKARNDMGTGRTSILLALALIALACGGGEDFDRSGLVSGEDDIVLFARASQQYFRGSLSSAREDFVSIVDHRGDSPFADDAELALRRIESDLSDVPDTSSVTEGPVIDGFPPLALVGIPAAGDAMRQLEAMFADRGCFPRIIEDPDAPGLTLILYPEGYMTGAQMLADSVASWLVSHGSVTVQPGGNVLPTVAPGHTGVVLVVGTDAVLQPGRPGTSNQ